ncbi:hypothetical protein ACFQRL_11285 [Microbacterium fluvii]|uniref:Uncharacterized protein n=1 Tax=Microbacterium fluvii TaxID=415215 RepID=A0ABW2HJ37_9MICO|nr:hypothetical protein [Microbacterium fluvii]MCU4673178.1 hypothetical protein [Microbacterium fluvii]
MALAIVTWRGENDGAQEFDAEIGANRFYAWGVGSGSNKRPGVELLATRSRTSPLQGPVEADARGRIRLRVPTDEFTRENHHLQLLSFRDDELRGPAASDLVEVPWRWRRDDPPVPMREEPRMSAPLSLLDRPMQPHPAPPLRALSAPPPGTPSMSQAQFLGALGGVISQVLPLVQQALPVLGRIFAPTPAPAAGPAPATPAAATAPAAPTAPSADLAQLLQRVLAEVTAAQSHSTSMSSPSYSYASIAPLLAALPALAPLLQNVLTPQTVQSLISAADPTKLLQQAIGGILDAARIGQQATDKLHEHLRELNPGVGDDLVASLIQGMSVSASTGPARTARISRTVRLELPELVPAELQGYPQVAFRQGEDITLPVSVTTPRPIPRAQLEVIVREAGSQRIVAQRRMRLESVEDGHLREAVTIPAAVTARLAAGQEYRITLRLSWRGKGTTYDTTVGQLVRLVGQATFDGIDTGRAPVRLDDVDRDRDWWHQAWVDTVEERSSRTVARLDYTYRLVPGTGGNRRRQTASDLAEHTERRREGTLRSGLDITVASLSRLAARLGGGEGFDDATMAALADDGFRAAFERAASCRIDLHGRRHARMAVWVWPEVKLHEVLLRVPGEISPLTGQVLAFEVRPVSVPIPALAHVVTTRSA